MKTLYKLTIVGVAVIFGLTGCLAAFAPFLGGTAGDGDLTTQTTLIDTTNTTESTSDPAGLAFTFNNVTSTLTNAIGQLILVNFSNGVVDAASGVIPGLTIYELLGVAAAGGEYDRGPAIAYTAVVTADTGGDSTARLTLDLDSATMSTLIEIAMDPALLTANGGTRLFNQDGDDTPAEVGEDAAFFYDVVGGAPVGAAGAPRDPLDGVSYTLPGAPTATDTTLLITGIDANSGGYADRFVLATLSPAFTVFTFSPSTLVWTQETVTPTYDGAGTLTLTLSDAVVAGEIYQIRVDEYLMTSNDTIFGFVQRGDYAQNDSGARFNRSNLLVESGSSYFTLNTGSTNDGNSGPPHYINVVFTGGVGDVLASTVTPDSIRFIMDDGNDGEDLYQLPYNYYVVQSGADGANTLRFYFAPTYDPYGPSLPGTDRWYVYVYPTVMEDNGTPAVATDDFPVLNISDQEAGVWSDTGTW